MRHEQRFWNRSFAGKPRRESGLAANIFGLGDRKGMQPSGGPRLAVETLEDRIVLASDFFGDLSQAIVLPPEHSPSDTSHASSLMVGANSPTTTQNQVTIQFKIESDWQAGFTGSMTIRNTGTTSIHGWTLEFDFPATLGEIWNARLVSQVGDHYFLSDAGYNARIAPGQEVSFGFNASPGNLTVAPTGYLFNGLPAGSATTPDLSGLPVVSVSEPTLVTVTTSTSTAGFFHTVGNQIVDSEGNNVRIAGVNWFGMETPNFTPHGLWARGYKEMMDQMKETGFNTIRLPFSNQLFDANSTPNSINYAKNPELVGLNGLGIMDKIVEYAEEIGLRILLDHHRSTAGNSAQESGLWYTPDYPETRWISDWVMLATRYLGNPTVIGADLHNEPHGPATWGTGNLATDWRLAAERAGNAILAVNPDWLIVVEGIETGPSGNYWWGGNLSNARNHPVRLSVEGRLVYSTHDYPSTVYNQSWFSDSQYPNNLRDVWDRNWGYLFRENIAPVLIGEFGTKLETQSDRLWLENLVAYIAGDLNGDGTSDLETGQLGVSWTYWSWNPNSGDTGGILRDDWTTIHTNKLNLIEPVQFTFPETGGSTPGTTSQRLDFSVRLSKPSTSTVTVVFESKAGSGTPGVDFQPANGTLTFAPGETTKVVSIALLSPAPSNPAEVVSIRLISANGAVLEGEPEVVVPPWVLPSLSISDVTVSESPGGSLATLDVRLSAAATTEVFVRYKTAPGTALPGSDFVRSAGVLTFNPGTIVQQIVVRILDDLFIEDTETFDVLLTSATGATILDGRGVVTILDNDSPVPPPPPPPPTDPVDPQPSASFVVKDDWGSGMVAEVAVRNNTSAAFSSWTLKFDFDGEITNIWNAEIVSRDGRRYTVRNAPWNGGLVPGGTLSFGFQANPGGLLASNFVLQGTA